MTALILPDRIPDILASVDLVGLVERYTGQHGLRDGVRLRWTCPHPDHADTDPSFVVYPRKRPPDFYCYGCGWGGDAITFITGVEGLSRAEAIERLADGIGLREWPQARVARPDPNRKKPHRRPAYTADELDAYVRTCHAALTTPAVLEHMAALGVLINGFPDAAIVSAAPAVLAWSYLLERGVSGADVRRYRIGYAITSHPRFRNLCGRLVLPCPDGVEARLIPGHTEDVWEPEQRYVVPSGDPKRPWGIDRIDPARGPLVVVEGVFDALALERAGVQAIALRCKRLHPADAAALRKAGFASVYLALDATPDVTPAVVDNLADVLIDAGVTTRTVRGPGTGDWGDLLRLPDTELVSAVAAGMAGQ
jgi:DNA primase